MPHLRRSCFWFALITLLVISGLWFFWPRRADLRAFEPSAMGRLEADMWRCYYDKRYLALGRDLWLTARNQYGFSPWDSTRIAWHAALAARAAQPVQTRAEAYAHALPDLKDYFRIICASAQLEAPVGQLASEELNWWVLRREHAGWKDYGQAISNVTAHLYSVPEPAVHASALLRAEMMNYRDARRQGLMKESDWQHIATRLGESYALLKSAVGTPGVK